MVDRRFAELSTEELADIWYALGGAETRHPGSFSNLVDTTLKELNTRLEGDLAPFLEARFRAHRLVDSREDAEANRKSAATGL